LQCVTNADCPGSYCMNDPTKVCAVIHTPSILIDVYRVDSCSVPVALVCRRCRHRLCCLDAYAGTTVLLPPVASRHPNAIRRVRMPHIDHWISSRMFACMHACIMSGSEVASTGGGHYFRVDTAVAATPATAAAAPATPRTRSNRGVMRACTPQRVTISVFNRGSTSLCSLKQTNTRRGQHP
jgi:hypothetical protein